MRVIKNFIKGILPQPALIALENHLAKMRLARVAALTTKKLFAKIYREGSWGRSDDPAQKFHSGSGSHDREIVQTYIDAVRGLLLSFDEKPDAVDLGCGDFSVGSAVRPYCRNYTACDIVDSLIKFNREKFKALNVDFRVLDLTTDELPAGDIVFIRQVLQHLSNQQILNALPRISAKYKYLVLTEHLPGTESFTANLDHQSGPDTRLQINSGIVLTQPPFNLKVSEERRLCEVAEMGGIIVTTAYRLA